MTTGARRKFGFSLMEVLISLGLMSIALVSLVAVLMTGLRSESQSTSRIDAQDLGMQIMGRTLSRIERFSDTQAQQFWDEDQSATPWDSGEDVRNRTTFRYEIRCYKLNSLPASTALSSKERNQLKKISVRIFWHGTTSGQAEGSSLTLTRLLNREV